VSPIRSRSTFVAVGDAVLPEGVSRPPSSGLRGRRPLCCAVHRQTRRSAPAHRNGSWRYARHAKARNPFEPHLGHAAPADTPLRNARGERRDQGARARQYTRSPSSPGRARWGEAGVIPFALQPQASDRTAGTLTRWRPPERPAANDDQGRARSSMTTHAAAHVASRDAPLIGERAATRGRGATEGGDEHSWVRSA